MKKIKVYASPAGGGKSVTLLIDAVKSVGQKIAFISIEMRASVVLNRIDNIVKFFKIEKSDIDITVLAGTPNPQYDLVGKLADMKNKYDIIIVDGFDIYPTIVEGENVFEDESPLGRKITFTDNVWNTLFSDKYFFQKQTKCHSLWISTHTHKDLANNNNATQIKFPASLSDKLELKKFSQRKHDEITKKSCMEVVDFDNRRIEQYNLSEIFKPV